MNIRGLSQDRNLSTAWNRHWKI